VRAVRASLRPHSSPCRRCEHAALPSQGAQAGELPPTPPARRSSCSRPPSAAQARRVVCAGPGEHALPHDQLRAPQSARRTAGKCGARHGAASCAESRLPPAVPGEPPAAPGRPGPATAANAPTPRAGRRTHWPARCSPSRWRLPSAHEAPSWPKGMRPLTLGALPPSGSTHRWFPAVVTGPRISVSKMPSSCTNLVGATGIEPVTPRL